MTRLEAFTACLEFRSMLPSRIEAIHSSIDNTETGDYHIEWPDGVRAYLGADGEFTQE